MSEQRLSRAFIRKARRALRRMSDLQRKLFLAMRFEEGMSYAKLAERHGIPDAQVHKEFVRALIILSASVREPEPWWRRLWPW